MPNIAKAITESKIVKIRRIGFAFKPLAPILNACETGSLDFINLVFLPSYSLTFISVVSVNDSLEPSSLIQQTRFTSLSSCLFAVIIASPPVFLRISTIFLTSASVIFSTSFILTVSLEII